MFLEAAPPLDFADVCRGTRAAHRAKAPPGRLRVRAPTPSAAARHRTMPEGSGQPVLQDACALLARSSGWPVRRAKDRAIRTNCFRRRCGAERARNAETPFRSAAHGLGPEWLDRSRTKLDRSMKRGHARAAPIRQYTGATWFCPRPRAREC